MSDSTTIRVSRRTHSYLKRMAAEDRINMDELVERLARTEWQSRIGMSLALVEPDDVTRAVTRNTGVAAAIDAAARTS